MQARENLVHAFQDDSEPDFELYPDIEAVPTTLIAAVICSGRNTVPETPAVVDEEELDFNDSRTTTSVAVAVVTWRKTSELKKISLQI
jgi:hypothetical protein